jgi:hypothetical protein
VAVALLARGDYEVVIARASVERWGRLEATHPAPVEELLLYLSVTPGAPHRNRQLHHVSGRRHYQGEEHDQVAFVIGGTTIYFLVVERLKRVVITKVQEWAVGGVV